MFERGLPPLIIASAILRRFALLSRRPFGPIRENRNGGAAPAARLGAAADASSTRSGSPPDRPPRLVSTSPPPSMKKLSAPCCIPCHPLHARRPCRHQPGASHLHTSTFFTSQAGTGQGLQPH